MCMKCIIPHPNAHALETYKYNENNKYDKE